MAKSYGYTTICIEPSSFVVVFTLLEQIGQIKNELVVTAITTNGTEYYQQ
jgi:hypothetical protein